MRTPVGAVALSALVLALAAASLADPAGAAFRGTAANQGSALAADVLDPPTAFTATRSCSGVAPALRSSTSATGTDATITVDRPAGVVAGDVLVAIVMHASSDAEPSGAGADGWLQTARANAGGTGGDGLMVLKVAGAAEPGSYTFSGLVAGSQTAAVVLAYSGADQADPWAAGPATSMNATSVTSTAASLTTAVAPTLLLAGLLVEDYASTFTTPAGATVRATVGGSGTVPVQVLVVDRPVAATGDTGGTSSTLTAARSSYGFSVALRAAPGPGPVVLSWTPTADLYAGGYEGYRSDIPGVIASLPSRTASGYSDATLGTAGATYYLRSYAGTWRSPYAGAAVLACP